MTKGPFEGLQLAEKAAMIARALMACGPRDLDQMVHWRLVVDGLLRVRPELFGQWIGSRTAGYPDHFIRVHSSLAGDSRGSLPEGETAAVMLESPPSQQVTAWLAAFAPAYERGAYGEPDAAAADRLVRTVYACGSDFHATMLGMLAQLSSPALVLQHVLTLKDLFHQRCVDATLLGCTAATYEIGTVTGWPRPVVDLLPAPPAAPGALLTAVVVAAAEAGFQDQLLALGAEWRDAIDDELEKARAAESAEAALETIYRALPRATAAVILYSALSRDRVATAVEERRVRMRHALAESILDFSGRRWRELRGDVARTRARSGDAAAEALARSFTEHHLLYPRALLPALLEGATGRPGFTPQGEDMVEQMLLQAVLGDQPDVLAGLTSEPFAQPAVPVRRLEV